MCGDPVKIAQEKGCTVEGYTVQPGGGGNEDRAKRRPLKMGSNNAKTEYQLRLNGRFVIMPVCSIEYVRTKAVPPSLSSQLCRPYQR